MNPVTYLPLLVRKIFLAACLGALPGFAAESPVHATIDEAIARGDVDDVKRHLQRDPGLVRGKEAKLAPLHQAILRRQAKIVALLLEQGADANAPDNSARTPVHLAVERGDAAVLKMLLARKPELMRRDKGGWTPLHHAAAKGRAEIATLLLDAGAQPNFLSELGGTALHEAAAAGSIEVAKLLLARGVDPSIRSKPGVTALDLAREYKHPEMVTLLEGAARR
jgi:ankyrin repeat protein